MLANASHTESVSRYRTSVMNSLALWLRTWPLLAAAACFVPAAATAQFVMPYDFEASGPLRVATDQVVSICATNYSGTVHAMLLAIVRRHCRQQRARQCAGLAATRSDK